MITQLAIYAASGAHSGAEQTIPLILMEVWTDEMAIKIG
jgi:hypothetical protein